MKKDYALKMDYNDPIGFVKNHFFVPQRKETTVTYLCGNSLGLQHKDIKIYIEKELNSWKKNAVDGHFIGNRPWVDYQEEVKSMLSKLLGSNQKEIAVMNSLSVNLHLLMVSFYRPDKVRFKILMEKNAFSSDRYVVMSHLESRNLSYEDTIIEVSPRDNEDNLRTEDIINIIEKNNDNISLVLLPGIQYYTGQLFDIEKITEECHRHKIIVGFDLAHAIGNVELNLSKWGVDFATWCSYKYLNSGPGGISGIYVNNKFHGDFSFPRYQGWWGNKIETRFQMNENIDPSISSEAWVMSNPPILMLASHLASLSVFNKIGFPKILEKGKLLTQYLGESLESLSSYGSIFKIITPSNRGSQLSLFFHMNGKKIFNKLTDRGFIVDYREPNVVRVTPVPLYNSFMDVYNFVINLEEIINDLED